MKTFLLSGIMLLMAFYSNSQNIQHLQYDVVVDSHSVQNAPIDIDNVFDECGYFYVSDSVITMNKEGNFPAIRYEISMKTLDLDCKCYYYFAKNDYLVVVNTTKGFVLVAKLSTELMYIRTYYLKTP